MDDKEFTFESEQILKKRNTRKIILIAAIAAAVIAAVVVTVILLVSAKRKKIHRSDEDLAYTYTWQENSEGGIDLSLSRGNASGYGWMLISADEGLTVSAPASQPDKSGEFTIAGSEAGRLFAVFGLQQADDPDTRIYEMTFALHTTASEEGNFTRDLEYVSGMKTVAAVDGGAETEHPYHIRRNDEEDTVLVLLEDQWTRQESSENTEKQREMLDEDVKALLEWMEKESDPRDNETSYKNPFTGEACSADELRKVLREHKDVLEKMLSEDLEPETVITIHEDWNAVSSNEEVVSVRNLTLDEVDEEDESQDRNQVIVTLAYGGTAGTAEVTLRSDTAGTQLRLSFLAEEGGSLTLTDHRLESFEPVIEESSEVPES